MIRRFDEQNAIFEDMINKTEMKSENNNLNTSLNEFRTEIKSEMREINNLIDLTNETRSQET